MVRGSSVSDDQSDPDGDAPEIRALEVSFIQNLVCNNHLFVMFNRKEYILN